MVLSVKDVELLKWICWCKNVPAETDKLFAGRFKTEDIFMLEQVGLLTKSRDGKHIRPRTLAYQILNEAGFVYKQELKPQTREAVLNRRNIASQILFTFYRAGISVFVDKLGDLLDGPVYLSSFAARQGEVGNPYGSTRFYGILGAGREAFLVLYADDFGVYFQKELTLFHNIIEHNRIQQTAVIIMGKSTAGISAAVIRPHKSGARKKKYNTNSFPEIYASTTLPIHFIPIGDAGAQILKFLLIPNYREAAARAVLKSRYRPPYPDVADTDTVHYKPPNYPALVALDMDVRRIDRALEASWSAGHEKIVLYALKEQIPFLKSRYGNAGKAEIFGIDVSLIKDAIGYDIQLSEPPVSAYVTAEGRCFDVTDLAAYRKAGKPGQKEARPGTQPE